MRSALGRVMASGQVGFRLPLSLERGIPPGATTVSLGEASEAMG